MIRSGQDSHYGAAHAAELAGRTQVARKRYEHLFEMAGEGDGRRKEMNRARSFLAKR